VTPPKAKKPQPVPGLTFEITVTPLRNGFPWPGVEAITTHWDKGILQWHEGHVDTGLMVVLRDVEARVRRDQQPRVRGRR
jgi:hypothetical protein